MCDPVSIALAAVSTAQSVMQFTQQKATRANAETAYSNELSALSLRQDQEAAAAGQAKFANAIEAAKARAEARAGAASANVSGNSIEAISRDYYFQQGQIDAAGAKNLRDTQQQLEREKLAAKSRLEGVPRANLASLGLNIASGALGAYNSHVEAVERAGKKS